MKHTYIHVNIHAFSPTSIIVNAHYRSLGMNNCLYDNTYQNYKLDQMVTGSMLPGQRVEADEQCKTILGDGWTFLKNFGDRKFTSGNAEVRMTKDSQYADTLLIVATIERGWSRIPHLIFAK